MRNLVYVTCILIALDHCLFIQLLIENIQELSL